jgi:hypothetical protein
MIIESFASYQQKLERTLDRMGGLFLPIDLVQAIDAGRMQAFVEGESLAVTQIAQFPRAKVLEVVAAIGDLPDLRVVHDRIVTYAVEIGAGLIQAYGREGWINDAERRGWKVKARSYLFQKEL